MLCLVRLLLAWYLFSPLPHLPPPLSLFARHGASLHPPYDSFQQRVLFESGPCLEAIRYYEPIVKRHSDNILNVTAIVLANLCVAYIMTSQNEEAEDLMRKIEKEEEQVNYQAGGY